MDYKAVGYFISTTTVFLLGIVAWPGPSEPRWKAWAIIVGMAASIIGMAIRYFSHWRDARDRRSG